MTSQSLVNESGRNVVRTHPYSHPLHMKVVKHLVCVWHWCEISFDWVYSLNHCTSPSFVAQKLPRFLGDFPKLGGRNVVRTHPYSHPQHMKHSTVGEGEKSTKSSSKKKFPLSPQVHTADIPRDLANMISKGWHITSPYCDRIHIASNIYIRCAIKGITSFSSQENPQLSRINTQTFQ